MQRLFIPASFPLAISPVVFINQWFRSDPRHFQIFFLSSFLLFGLFFLSWSVSLHSLILAASGALITQYLGNRFMHQSEAGYKSALVSTLSIGLMLRADESWVFLLAGVLSIASKWLIRYRGKHVFNPTNFGILISILLSGCAWVSPGQWGSDTLWLLFTGMAGLLVLLRAGRLDTGITFLAVYLLGSLAFQVLWRNWPLDFWYHQLSSGTLLLFSFFMITDPKATPSHRIGRILFASAVALLSLWLQIKMFRYDAPLWALLILSPSTILFDKLFIHSPFKWN